MMTSSPGLHSHCCCGALARAASCCLVLSPTYATLQRLHLCLLLHIGRSAPMFSVSTNLRAYPMLSTFCLRDCLMLQLLCSHFSAWCCEGYQARQTLSERHQLIMTLLNLSCCWKFVLCTLCTNSSEAGHLSCHLMLALYFCFCLIMRSVLHI